LLVAAPHLHFRTTLHPALFPPSTVLRCHPQPLTQSFLIRHASISFTVIDAKQRITHSRR
jgi:hypothetical protein